MGAVFSAAPGAPPAAANCFPLANYSGLRDAPGRSFSGAAALPPTAQPGWWTLSGGAADYYLAPAATALDYLKSLYELTGAPGIPPRYAFGSFNAHPAAPARCAHKCDPNDPNTQSTARPTLNQQVSW